MKIGIDVIAVKRIKKLLEDSDALAKVFSLGEIELVKECPIRLAGRWAAKEALMKALGKKIDWLSVQVLNRESGEPYLSFDYEGEVLLSISHEQEYAVAVVVLV